MQFEWAMRFQAAEPGASAKTRLTSLPPSLLPSSCLPAFLPLFPLCSLCLPLFPHRISQISPSGLNLHNQKVFLLEIKDRLDAST